ncbi:MAG: hypothetical protein SGBAC_001575, partial [Bacillariaceae sp.]
MKVLELLLPAKPHLWMPKTLPYLTIIKLKKLSTVLLTKKRNPFKLRSLFSVLKSFQKTFPEGLSRPAPLPKRKRQKRLYTTRILSKVEENQPPTPAKVLQEEKPLPISATHHPTRRETIPNGYFRFSSHY